MSFRRIMAVLVVLGSLVAAAQADTVLYQDTFTSNAGTTLSAHPLDVTSSQYGATASAPWTASSYWQVNAVNDNAYVNSSSVIANAWLPLTPQAGCVYTLSAGLYLMGYDWEGGDYLALGFAYGATGLPSTGASFYGAAKNWMVFHNLDDGEDNTFKVGTCMETASGWEDGDITYSGTLETGYESYHTFEMTLDTTGASWTATYSMDGDDYGSKTYLGPGGGGVPNITAVGLGIGGKYCQVDNFSLTVVPEPSSLALLVAGLVGLLCYAWRKRK